MKLKISQIVLLYENSVRVFPVKIKSTNVIQAGASINITAAMYKIANIQSSPSFCLTLANFPMMPFLFYWSIFLTFRHCYERFRSLVLKIEMSLLSPVVLGTRYELIITFSRWMRWFWSCSKPPSQTFSCFIGWCTCLKVRSLDSLVTLYTTTHWKGSESLQNPSSNSHGSIQPHLSSI